MEKTHPQPQELFVYECRGSGYPLMEPACEGFLGLWREHPFYYIFFDREAISSVKRWLDDQDGWELMNTYRLNYDEWQQVSRSDLRVGPFIIRTGRRDERDCPPSDGIPIRLDPDLVFGSGLHASTRGCLLAIEWLFSVLPLRTVVDFGTGTGILATASALMGARRVFALDCNPMAVRVAQRNIRANGVQDSVELLVSEDLKSLGKSSDLLLMNIEWPSLKAMLQGEEWLGYEWVVLSGFLSSQWSELRMLVPPAWRTVLCYTIDGWQTVALSKKSKVAA